MFGILRNLSKGTVSLLVVTLTLLGLYFYDAPLTDCDVQVEALRGPLNARFLRGDRKEGLYKNSARDLWKFCMTSNSQGGCRGFFQRLVYFEKVLSSLPSDCSQSSAIEKFEPWYRRAIHLMVFLAWGELGPATSDNSAKGGWLTVYDQLLYCRLVEQYEKLYGTKKRKGLQRQVLGALAKDREMAPLDIKDKTLLTVDCDLLRSSNR